jgi:DNA-binding NarL/FixJ family response regulator
MTTILIIDDEAPMRRNLAEILRLEGYATLEAGDGAAGLVLARDRRPDLILCDITMPDTDGHAVLHALKATPATARIPFVFVTARSEHTDVRHGMNRGADDYLIKPVGIEDLIAAVQARLARHREHEAIAPAASLPREPAELQSLGLTPREAEILFWITRGKTNPEIGIILDMKLVTVKKHVQNVLEKLGVENRTAAVSLVVSRTAHP